MLSPRTPKSASSGSSSSSSSKSSLGDDPDVATVEMLLEPYFMMVGVGGCCCLVLLCFLPRPGSGAVSAQRAWGAPSRLASFQPGQRQTPSMSPLCPHPPGAPLIPPLPGGQHP